ncbi:MAG: hypothetical protein GY750_06180 [Lentisphaerae bacterium]|nr:hypothetical protein [Lentisphaerota bacterium]MCP4100996.1 hypothetical protein [Lentisphaerota bacterium]
MSKRICLECGVAEGIIICRDGIPRCDECRADFELEIELAGNDSFSSEYFNRYEDGFDDNFLDLFDESEDIEFSN